MYSHVLYWHARRQTCCFPVLAIIDTGILVIKSLGVTGIWWYMYSGVDGVEVYWQLPCTGAFGHVFRVQTCPRKVYIGSTGDVTTGIEFCDTPKSWLTFRLNLKHKTWFGSIFKDVMPPKKTCRKNLRSGRTPKDEPLWDGWGDKWI